MVTPMPIEDGVELPRRCAPATRRRTRAVAGDRAGGHQRPAAVAVEPPADRHGDRGTGQDRGGERAGDRGGRGVQVGGHRAQQDGEGVVEDAVPDGLGDREGGDDPPAAEPGRRPPRSTATGAVRVIGSAAAAAGLRLVPWLDVTRQSQRRGSSPPADAGRQAPARPAPRRSVPQQPPPSAIVSLSTTGLLLQTPVSGRSSWTSRAAVPVAGQRGDDRAGLLVAGGEQERRARGRSSSRRWRSSRARGGSSSSTPCGGTVPQECSFGSISGASARVEPRIGSRSRRSSDGDACGRAGSRWPTRSGRR